MTAMLSSLSLLILVPVIFVLILRRLGVVRGMGASLALTVVCIFLLAAASDRGWIDGFSAFTQWFDENSEMLDACTHHDDAHITLEFKGGEPYLSCSFPKKKDNTI